MRCVLLLAAAAACACGSSSNGPNSFDGGADASVIFRHPDAGSSSGGGGDAGVGAVVAPTGTQVLAAPAAYLEGITDDGYAVYEDTSTGTLEATSINGPGAAPKTITTQATDYLAGLFVSGTTLLMLSGTSNASQVGKLTVWTSAGGTKTLSNLSTITLLDLSSDGTKIVYYDNVSEMGGTLQTGDLTVSNIDGTGKTVLQPGVTLSGGACLLQAAQVVFLGADIVALSCTPMVDGGVPNDAGVAGDGGDGGATSPGGPTETLTSYSGASFAPSILSSQVIAGTSFGTDRGTGKPGSQILFLTPGGLVNDVVATGVTTVITTDVAATASYSADGTQILFLTSTGSAVEAPISDPTATTALASGNYNYVVAQSPDAKSQFALIATTENRDPLTNAVTSSDMFLLSTTSSNTPVALSASTSAAAYGQAFTADSNFAVFDDSVSGGVGTLYAQATNGTGSPVELAPNSWIDDEPTGSLVFFNANCSSCTTMYVPGQADIEYVDLSTGTTAKTIVTQADYNFYLTKDKSKLVYSWHPTMKGGLAADAGASKAGIWVWPLP